MEDNRYGIVIQARMSSSRLPGKVLMDIEGKPMLQRQTERLRSVIKDFPIIVATSEHESDDPIKDFCLEHNIICFRGALDNVLLRFINCAKEFNLTHIVRVGGDDPLIDPNCCLELIKLHKNQDYDFIYASNREGWPYGCAAELISLESLELIYKSTANPIYLEHTIPYFFDYPEEFKIFKAKSPYKLRRPELAFTVDYPEDLELIRCIFKKLNHEGHYFSLDRVIHLLDENKDLQNINKHRHSGFDR